MAAVGKFHDREQTAVGAFFAVTVRFLIAEIFQFLFGDQRGDMIFAEAFFGDNGRAVSAHEAGNIGTDDLPPGFFFECAKHRFVIEGAALSHDLLAEIFGTADLDNFVKGVLDDGIGQAGGDIFHGGAFLLRLFYFGVHKNGAAVAQIHGILGIQSTGGELFYRHVQTFGESFDEGTAPRRAGFVQDDAFDHAVADTDGFHILAADIENKLYAGQEVGGGFVVSHRFHFAHIGFETGTDQVFAVAGDGGVGDMSACGKQIVDLSEDLHAEIQGFALVIFIMGIDDVLFIVHQNGFGGGGTGVDAQKEATFRFAQGLLSHMSFGVAAAERGKVFFGRKQRFQSFAFRNIGQAQFRQTTDQLRDRLCFRAAFFFGGEGAAVGYIVMRVRRQDRRFFGQTQRTDESVAQFRQEVKGTAQKSDVAADGLAAGQTADGLVDDGLKDRGGDIFFCGALIEQRLNIGFGENAAAGSDGIDHFVILRQLVKAGGVGLEQKRHLIDKGAGSAGAGAVHPLFRRAAEIGDLGVFTAEFDHNIGFGYEGFHRFGASDYFLNEIHMKMIRKAQPSGTGNGHFHIDITDAFFGLFQYIFHRGADIGKMPLVTAEKALIIFV